MKRQIADIVGRFFNINISRIGHSYQFVEVDYLRRFFQHFEVDCVFDVGANEGQYAQKLRRKVGYKGSIISFEPIPDAAAKLRELSEDDPHWFVEEVALDSSVRSAVFNIMVSSRFSSLQTPSTKETVLFKDIIKTAEQISITTATLNIFFEKYRDLLRFKRPYLKIDTQGHDAAVVEGAGVTIREFVGLQSELSVKRVYEGSLRYQESLEIYTKAGFELSSLVMNNHHFPALIEMDVIMFNQRFGPELCSRE